MTPEGEHLELADGAWREVALSDDEYACILRQLGRKPTPVELGMFGAMWSEHCGYKHSRPLLRLLPSDAPWVMEGPGENAGAVDVGDGLAVVFKVESHNHPSAVEPYQGAATAVGGIVRDIFTMGARPIALLNTLRFGPQDQRRNRYLFSNVVAGIGGYGNCVGIPTVGGDVSFDPAFDHNPLVNAMCVGVTPHAAVTRSGASGVGNLLMLIGAPTGRDGLHGATFASVDDPRASHRGVVQVGNPFLEKLLLEACLELRAVEGLVAMQDLGAAGLTSSVVECAARGGVGATIDVDLVPRREAGLSAHDVMLSESQERMLLVVEPDHVDHVREVVEHWSLDATVIGEVTDDGRVTVRAADQVVADVPASLLTDGCPTYEPEAIEDPAAAGRRELDLSAIPDIDPEATLHYTEGLLARLLNSRNVGSRRWIYEQFDHTIQTNTVIPPGVGDAALLRLKGTDRGIAVAIDCNSRYCFLDPELGARHAVAEACRNVACVGGQPLAVTNCLNFGNPQKPGSAFQLQQAVVGMAAACRALGVPVVSGNVSLYNESHGVAVMPTPTIGVVGVLANVERHATMRWERGQVILLVGGMPPTLGGSEYLAEVHGITGGSPPEIDLVVERGVQRVLHESIAAGLITAAHDCSEGGIAVALAEMAIVSGIGARIDAPLPVGCNNRLDEALFGEAASSVLVSVPEGEVPAVQERCDQHDIRHRELGRVGGNRLVIGDRLDVAIKALQAAYESAFCSMDAG